MSEGPEGLDDAALAAAIARTAGEVLLALASDTILGERLKGRTGDLIANEIILAALGEHRPADAVLTEESEDDRGRLDCPRVWIIDPLDGTREFAAGRSDWAVHVALAIDGRAAIGAVALPPRGLVLRSDRPPPLPAPASPPRMLVSSSRAPAETAALARELGAQVIAMGSAGVKTAAVLLGEAEIYYHAGGQHEWDSCAPAAVALATGFDATRIDGSPLIYNRRDTRIPDLVVSHPALTSRVRAAIARVTGRCGAA